MNNVPMDVLSRPGLLLLFLSKDPSRNNLHFSGDVVVPNYTVVHLFVHAGTGEAWPPAADAA